MRPRRPGRVSTYCAINSRRAIPNPIPDRSARAGSTRALGALVLSGTVSGGGATTPASGASVVVVVLVVEVVVLPLLLVLVPGVAVVGDA